MANKVPERRSAKDDSTPMDDADINLVIEAMYQVAADPERWDQLVDALAEAPATDHAPVSAVRGLAHSQEIARIVGGQVASAPVLVAKAVTLGWILLTSRRKVAAANAAAHAIIANGLGELRVGKDVGFDDPSNLEALSQAIAQTASKTTRHAILKLDREGDDGSFFGFVVPAKSLTAIAGSEVASVAVEEGAYAIIFPAGEETARLWSSIRESFGLTPAEMRLAARLREGQTLKEAADEMAVSINTVRNQLRAIFDKMGLKRQGDLIRALGEMSQVASALGVDEAEGLPTVNVPPPVLSIGLKDGRRLAYREYGVSSGRAMMMFHEGLGSSLLPPGVQALAQQLGMRVISAERPGFGQSDPRDDYSFDGVADDMVELCDQLGLQDVQIGAVLSGAPSAIQTAIRLGTRAHGVLLCSGRPPRLISRDSGIMTQFRLRLQSHPWVIESLYAILRLRMSAGMVQHMTQSSTADSPGDRAFLAANPWVVEFVSSYVSETLSRGSRGPVDEMKAFKRASNMTAADLTCPLVVWHGENDHFAPLSDLLDYLGDKATQVRVFPDTGHLMALKHWDEMLRHAAA